MELSLCDIFKDLVHLQMDYSVDDFTNVYRDISASIDINDYLGYGEVRKDYTGIFHVVLNIKVSDQSDFVPFISAIGSLNGKCAKYIAESLMQKNIIKYNFVDFVAEIVSKMNKHNDVPRLSFATVIDDTGEIQIKGTRRFKIKTGSNPWYKPSVADYQNEDFKSIIPKNEWDDSFVKILSQTYFNELGLKTLYYTIISIDSNYNNTGRLTQIQIISSNKDEASFFLDNTLEKLREIASFIRTRYVSDLLKKSRNEAIKSAKAAIMSRNMSHNLGSHVMSYLKQKLGSVTSIMKEENKVLNELIPQTIKKDVKNYLKENYDIATSILDNIDKWEPTKIENVELPFLVGLGRFINYLQERQDYIATISTDYIPYGAPVNLKDAIYDELNPDLRYLRHKQERNNDAKNRPANILLNYIAKSEGLSRENMQDNFHSEKDIRIGFIDYSSNKPRIFGVATQNDIQAFESRNEALTQMRKYNFSLPGGLVGRQAVFSIIENLIRNAAKHGDTSGVANLDFTLDVIDGSDIAWDVAHHKNKKIASKTRSSKTYSKVMGWDIRVRDENWRRLYESASDLDDIYLLTITDNLRCDQGIINNLKSGLEEPFIDPSTGQMTTANKGIKEVRISAAWIRGVTDEDRYLRYKDAFPNDHVNKLAPLVAVEKSADEHLRYIICVRKNKTVAVVSEVKIKIKFKNGNEKIKIAKLKKKTLDKFIKLHENNKDRWTILTDDELKNSKTSYSFILCPNDVDAFNELRPFTSNRLCRWEDNKESQKALLALDKDDQTLMYVYRLFTGLNDKNEIIFIEDDRAETANKDREHAENKQHFEKIQFVNIDNKEPIQYLYRTHHATEKEYKGFYTKYINEEEKYECVEGITGDNSSDRLIRREWLDEKWYYTHLYAMKKKVAIIDERIFRMVHNIDERLFVKDSNENIQTKELGNIIPGFSIENIKEQLVSFIDDDKLVEPIYMAKTINELAELVPEIPRNLVESKQVNNTVLGESHMTPYYHGKAVDIYTVVKSAEGDMILVGCTKTEFDAVKNKFNNNFEKMATFKRDTTGCIVLEPVSEYSSLLESHYDYISIHQGILDKIYENLDIKNKDEEKCQLTKCIHQRLMADKTTIGDYLPCFVIHSGRAKPTKEDMPQKQPFIQYAAIENAVKDCKPMLVELLDFAKYEPTNN